MLLLMLEAGMPIDCVLTADTGMEFPEMYRHWDKIDQVLYQERGIHLTILRHSKGFEWLKRGAFLLSAGRTGDFKQRVNGSVQQLRLGGVRQSIVDLFPIPVAFNDSALFQNPQVVGYSRVAHSNSGGDIAHTFLAVTKQPENTQAGRVANLLERGGGHLESVRRRHPFQDALNVLPMIMGKMVVGHGIASISSPIISCPLVSVKWSKIGDSHEQRKRYINA